MSGQKERLMLEVVGAAAAPAELPLSGMLSIGSSKERAGFVLEEQGVAEVHCAIGRTKNGGYAIKDLGSEYGTLVNGIKVSQARLKKGDEILLGSVRLTLVGTGAPRSDQPPKASAPSPARKKKQKAPLPEIAGYRLQQLIGKGAMGDVYLAVQVSLDREVALKVLSKKHEADQAFVASFQAEARAAAALNHPNVVTVHDVGQQDGVHYLTMEYMDRSSLEERIAKEGPLPWTLVLKALKDAASGLVYAESRGIVHRDIKPANLMQNQTGTTKIADLGLATSISQEENPVGENKIFGTPHFISPEQIKGQKADCRSDLYSLGCTAYRLLTGHTPYQGKNTREILRAKLKADSIPILERASDVPTGLVRTVERLMELEPENRFPSATALLRELERLGSTGNGDDSEGGESATGTNWMKLAIPAFLLGLIGIVALVLNQEAAPVTRHPKGTQVGQQQPAGDKPARDVADDPSLTSGEIGDEPGELVPVDNDIKEQLFEREAENAYLRLGQQDIPLAERRDALRDLAVKFLGTTVANQAVVEANELDKQLKSNAKETVARTSAIDQMMAKLMQLANLENPTLLPGQTLSSLASADGIEAFAADPVFQDQYRSLRNRVVATALDQFVARAVEIDTLQSSGDFAAVREALHELLTRSALPPLEEDNRPARLDEISGFAAQLEKRIETLGTSELEFKRKRLANDESVTSSGLGAGSGLYGEIARLDLAAASKRLGPLRGQVRSAVASAKLEAFAQVLESASKALPILWEDQDWRRKTVDDPTDRRLGSHDMLKVSATGLLIENGDQPKQLVWADFGANTKALRKLFYKRLRRDYDAEEERAISSLLYLTAVAESFGSISGKFQPGSNMSLNATEVSDLVLPYDEAFEYITQQPTRAALEQEKRATQVLGQALLFGQAREWTSAVAEMETLRREFSETWLVRLLSDGSLAAGPE